METPKPNDKILIILNNDFSSLVNKPFKHWYIEKNNNSIEQTNIIKFNSLVYYYDILDKKIIHHPR